jgi:hypothetical protein
MYISWIFPELLPFLSDRQWTGQQKWAVICVDCTKYWRLQPSPNPSAALLRWDCPSSESTDTVKRLQHCRWFGLSSREMEWTCSVCLFSAPWWIHEVRTAGSGQVKIHIRYMRNPYIHKKTGVWCAMSRRWSAGPTVCETTADREVYQELMSVVAHDERYCWLQQDGATCCSARETTDYFTTYFDIGLIS